MRKFELVIELESARMEITKLNAVIDDLNENQMRVEVKNPDFGQAILDGYIEFVEMDEIINPIKTRINREHELEMKRIFTRTDLAIQDKELELNEMKMVIDDFHKNAKLKQRSDKEKILKQSAGELRKRDLEIIRLRSELEECKEEENKEYGIEPTRKSWLKWW